MAKTTCCRPKSLRGRSWAGSSNHRCTTNSGRDPFPQRGHAGHPVVSERVDRATPPEPGRVCTHLGGGDIGRGNRRIAAARGHRREVCGLSQKISPCVLLLAGAAQGLVAVDDVTANLGVDVGRAEVLSDGGYCHLGCFHQARWVAGLDLVTQRRALAVCERRDVTGRRSAAGVDRLEANRWFEPARGHIGVNGRLVVVAVRGAPGTTAGRRETDWLRPW